MLSASRKGAGHNWINWKDAVWTRKATPKNIVKLVYTRRGAAAVRGRLWRKKLIAKKATVAKPAERATNK
jgi:hypothetical protein